jgi:hypothetical protein
MDRDFLFYLAERQNLYKHEEMPVAFCIKCGRDIFGWEIANGYFEFDGSFYCVECFILN